MMSKLLATCAALAITAVVALPIPAANAAETHAAATTSMKTGAIEVSSARRHYYRHHYRRYYGPSYGYYGRPYYGGYGAYGYDPYYRPAPYVGFGIGPFGFGIW